jgi:hypothetical protein
MTYWLRGFASDNRDTEMTTIRRFVLVALISLPLLITSCVTGEKMSSLNPGMTKSQVIATLGRPDGYQNQGDYEVLKYTNKLVSGFSWDKADYYSILRDGKLVEYGAGQVRQDESHKFVIVKTL